MSVMNAVAFLVFTLAFASSAWGNPWTGKDALQYEWNPTINIFPKAIDSLELYRSEFKLFKYQDFDLRSIDRHAVNKNDLSNYRYFQDHGNPVYKYRHEGSNLILEDVKGRRINEVGCADNCKSLEYDPLILGTLIPKDLANKWIRMKVIGASRVVEYGRITFNVLNTPEARSEIKVQVTCLKAGAGNLMFRCHKGSREDFLYGASNAPEDYKRTAILVFRLAFLQFHSLSLGDKVYNIPFDLIFQV